MCILWSSVESHTSQKLNTRTALCCVLFGFGTCWFFIHGPLTRCVKLWVAHAPGMSGTYSPPLLQRKLLVSDSGMYHGTCVTHMPSCMSGSLIRGGGENVPGIPGACATRNFTYLARGQCLLGLLRWHWGKVLPSCQWSNPERYGWRTWRVSMGNNGIVWYYIISFTFQLCFLFYLVVIFMLYEYRIILDHTSQGMNVDKTEYASIHSVLAHYTIFTTI